MRRLVAIVGAGGLLVLSGAAPVAAGPSAAEGDVDVVNTETVQVYMSAAGEIRSQRVYEQLVLTGKGAVEVRNPVESDGLRNLDGFGGFDVQEGVQVSEVDVDGVERSRTVSNYDGELPLAVDATYLLDGEEVEPGDVVGESGRLEVRFEVENVTGQEQEVTLTNGRGGTTTTTAEVPVPMVGSLTTVAPEGFTNVTSDEANMAGDGRGGTKLSFTMTLFPPIASTTATFGYTADIEDGVVPRVDITALPVNPLKSPSFKTAASSYEGGSATGEELAAGATEIDGHLLEMRDGAAELLAGLIKLHEGSQELQDGLAGKAAPGAERLAGGASDLRDGLGKIDDGAGELADGAGRLSGGTGDALSGSVKLRDGLGQISGGLERLSDSEGLPKAAEGVDLLKAGVDRILAGFGEVGTADTLIDGLHRIETGATQLSGGASQLKGGLTQLAGAEGLVKARGGVDQVKAGLDESTGPGGSIDSLVKGLQTLLTLDCGPICASVINTQILPGVEQSRVKLQEAAGGLGLVSTGLTGAIGALDTQLIPGAEQISAGTSELAAGATKAKGGAVQLKDGVSKVKAGLVELDEGLTKAVAGVLRLSSGASDAHAGSGDLADGLGLIDNGAGELADGAGRLADGTGEASAGSGLLSDGAGELASGLLGAADGSGRLTDGLGRVAGGAPKLVDGAGRLSKEGSKVIAGKGVETAQSYGELYAVMQAGAQRAEAERMAYGAPDGARGLTAYTYILTGEDGEGGRNWARGIAGIGLLGAGLGAAAWRRRLL